MHTVPEAKRATVQGRVQSSAQLCKQCCIIMTAHQSERTDPNVLLICLPDSGAHRNLFFSQAGLSVMFRYPIIQSLLSLF